MKLCAELGRMSLGCFSLSRKRRMRPALPLAMKESLLVVVMARLALRLTYPRRCAFMHGVRVNSGFDCTAKIASCFSKISVIGDLGGAARADKVPSSTAAASASATRVIVVTEGQSHRSVVSSIVAVIGCTGEIRDELGNLTGTVVGWYVFANMAFSQVGDPIERHKARVHVVARQIRVEPERAIAAAARTNVRWDSIAIQRGADAPAV